MKLTITERYRINESKKDITVYNFFVNLPFNGEKTLHNFAISLSSTQTQVPMNTCPSCHALMNIHTQREHTQKKKSELIPR